MDLIQAAVFHRRGIERLGRSEATLKLYAIYQNSFLAFLLEHEVEPTLDALNPQFVREWQGWLRGRSNGRRGGLVTERQGVTTLKTWARWLVDNDVYAYDPLGRLKVPRVQKLHRKPFTEAQVEIKKKIKEDRQQAQMQKYLDKLRERTSVWTIFDEAKPAG